MPEARYLTSKRRRTRMRRIQRTWLGMRALAVPFLFPTPVWRPARRASWRSRVRLRECIALGFSMMRPSETKLRMVLPVIVPGPFGRSHREGLRTGVGVGDLIHLVRIKPDPADSPLGLPRAMTGSSTVSTSISRCCGRETPTPPCVFAIQGQPSYSEASRCVRQFSTEKSVILGSEIGGRYYFGSQLLDAGVGGRSRADFGRSQTSEEIVVAVAGVLSEHWKVIIP